MRDSSPRCNLPPPEQFRRFQCLESLSEFIREFWPIIESCEFKTGWHIEAICDHLEAVTRREIRFLLINMPPRHMKSLAISVFWPAWEFANGIRRDWLYTSGGYDLALRDSVKCRRIIESEKFQRWFPEVRTAPDQNTKGLFDLAEGGRRDSVSAGSRQVTGKGGDTIVTDDLHDANATENDIKAKVEWWTGTLATRANDPKTAAFVVVMQRLSVHDISGWILENEPNKWTHLNLPLEFEPAEKCKTPLWEDPRQKPGEHLWPGRYTAQDISSLKRRLGPVRAAGQLQQQPFPAGGTEFKQEWLQNRFEVLNVAEVDRWGISIDASFKGEETSDWCVMGLLAKVGPRYYEVDVLRRKLSYPELRSTTREFVTSWRRRGVPVDTVLIEDKANGPALIADLQKEISGIVPFSPKDSKVVRYRAISGILAAQQFYLPADGAYLLLSDGRRIDLRPEFWREDFVAELLSIPGGLHDDQADQLAQGVIYFESFATAEPLSAMAAPARDVFTVERKRAF